MYTSDKTKSIVYIGLQISRKFRNKILIFSFHSDALYPLDTMSNEKASSFNFKGAVQVFARVVVSVLGWSERD